MGRAAVDSQSGIAKFDGMSDSSLAPRARRLLWQRTWLAGGLLLVGSPLGFIYVYLSFTEPHPAARILLRSVPILPLAIWTLWFDRQRPFERVMPAWRMAVRVLALLLIMALTVMLLGVALNWLYDPTRVL
jgi:hypothetical protein